MPNISQQLAEKFLYGRVDQGSRASVELARLIAPLEEALEECLAVLTDSRFENRKFVAIEKTKLALGLIGQHDPNEAPDGYIALLSPGAFSGCKLCAFHPLSEECWAVHCNAEYRKDKHSVYFKIRT